MAIITLDNVRKVFSLYFKKLPQNYSLKRIHRDAAIHISELERLISEEHGIDSKLINILEGVYSDDLQLGRIELRRRTYIAFRTFVEWIYDKDEDLSYIVKSGLHFVIMKPKERREENY